VFFFFFVVLVFSPVNMLPFCSFLFFRLVYVGWSFLVMVIFGLFFVCAWWFLVVLLQTCFVAKQFLVVSGGFSWFFVVFGGLRIWFALTRPRW